tara:strand:+ start:3094 stop:3543 length:450 start_codon:yes stop_codon:yes gene_type:complete
MKNLHIDIYIGILMFFTSTYFYTLTLEMPQDPATFPQLILTVLIVFSIIVFTKGFITTIKSKRENNKIDRYLNDSGRPLVLYISIVLYVISIDLIGFFTASTIASAFFIVFFGVRNLRKIILVLLGINVFIYALFVWQLKIYLPTGLFI